MHDSFGAYLLTSFHNLNTAIINLFMFLPHFFSVNHSLKTLFSPWKNIISQKSKPGFSFEEFGRRLADNFISRFMGFFARISIIAAFVLFQMFFVMLVPFLYILFFLLAPLSYLYYTSRLTPSQQKKQMRKAFIKRHLAEPKNSQKVLEWFERYYHFYIQEPWWSMESLMKQPPLGRDLTSGYTPQLDKYVNELTTAKPHYVHLIGRKKELEHIQQALLKTEGANVLLVGEKGVGRQAIIEALAKNIYEGTIHPSLTFKRILELDMNKIFAEFTDTIKREEKLQKLLAEAAQAKNVILIIRDLEDYVSSDKGKTNISKVLEKFAESPTIHFIATTTPYNFQKYIYPNKIVTQLFENIDVNEVPPQTALTILLDVALELENKHGVRITYQALDTTVQLAHSHITHAPFPEKAIELLDEACVYAKNHGPENAVSDHIVKVVLEQKTHVPTEVSDTLKGKLLHLEDTLLNQVVFQDNAIKRLASALRKAFVMAGSRRKPLASFLFLGPTGVGKTETAKAITRTLFHEEENMIRFDMSLYQSKQDIDKLVGSQATGEPGLLTQTIRQQRYGTLLLDELEKAHPDLLNIFLTILDEGYFSDSFGKKVDCTNLIIVATSNAGAQLIYKKVQEDPESTSLETELIDHLVVENIYSPEFLNRFDGVIVYRPLSQQAVKTIAQKMLRNITISVQNQHGIKLQFSEPFLTTLAQEGFDPRFGARNMQRTIRDRVEDTIAKSILAGEVKKGGTLSF